MRVMCGSVERERSGGGTAGRGRGRRTPPGEDPPTAPRRGASPRPPGRRLEPRRATLRARTPRAAPSRRTSPGGEKTGRSREGAGGRAPRSIEEQIRGTARPGHADDAVRAFNQAVDLLERGRDTPAIRAAEEAKSLAPRAGAVREVLGIALYRAERFREALGALQAYRRMTGRLDQNHLIADCQRALGSPDKAVKPAMEALQSAAPDEVRAEAAVVGAAALADLGRYTEGLGMVRSFKPRSRSARDYELRVWYVAGDILERAGRRTEAAKEFRRVVRHDPGAFDAAERLAALGG